MCSKASMWTYYQNSLYSYSTMVESDPLIKYLLELFKYLITILKIYSTSSVFIVLPFMRFLINYAKILM